MDRSGGPDACWLWTACQDGWGYGKFNLVSGESSRTAHRVAYMLHHGIELCSRRQKVCHDCPGGDNPQCVNPAHLFLGTDDQNLKDMDKKGRRAVGERHGSAKLSWAERDTIIWLYRSWGYSGQRIARWFPVSRSEVYYILSGVKWWRSSGRPSATAPQKGSGENGTGGEPEAA